MWISFWRKCWSKVRMISAVHCEINLILINKIYLLIKTIYVNQYILSPIPVAARSKAWVCGCPLAGIVGSNTTGSKNSVVSVVCNQVEGWSFVQRSPTECVCVQGVWSQSPVRGDHETKSGRSATKLYIVTYFIKLVCTRTRTRHKNGSGGGGGGSRQLPSVYTLWGVVGIFPQRCINFRTIRRNSDVEG